MVRCKSRARLSDQQLFSSLLEGNLHAFDQLVIRYKRRLLNFVFRFVGDQQTAEDIVQETFLRVYGKRKEYRSIANLSTWMFTIAGNLAKSELRRRKRWRVVSINQDEEGSGIDIADESHRPDEITEEKIRDGYIQEAINSLPPKYREVVLLRDIEGLPYEEIARMIGCPVGTAKSRVNRGRLQLQEKLRRVIEEM
ncbi:MAG TPA: sigma-70 family RNA polymerase sigma factor [Candidatus Latescibacteria bacterium]|nr:sigma-70 family RNA polymerase sigma factor [Candidatus Latescibacterota bacterium]